MWPERFAVVGDPVGHSLSPAMHNAALRAAGIEAGYGAIRLAATELTDGVQRLGALGYRGINVTVPHKEAMIRLVDRVAPSANEVGAVNTVVYNNRLLEGHNTDSAGFRAALRQWAVDVSGRRAVVFGAGGAARAVVHALFLLEAQVVIVNRSVEKARRLAAETGDRTEALPADSVTVVRALEQADLVVNTTTLGMGDLAACSPLPRDIVLPTSTVAIDLVYGRQTPFLRSAAGQGCRTLDGLEMLIQQGAESFRLWTNLEPDLNAMRQACMLRLAEVEACSAS